MANPTLELVTKSGVYQLGDSASSCGPDEEYDDYCSPDTDSCGPDYSCAPDDICTPDESYDNPDPPVCGPDYQEHIENPEN